MGLQDRDVHNGFTGYGSSKWVYRIGKLPMGLHDRDVHNGFTG